MKKYFVIGENIDYSLSPEIQKSLGIKNYSVKNLTEKELKEFFEKKDFSGINITVPFKEKSLKFLDEISPEAKSIGAVNTVININGKLHGFNTDVYGFTKLIEHENFKIKNKTVLIMGTGGASKAVKFALEKFKPKKIYTVGRKEKINYSNVYNECKDTEILINATPVVNKPLVDISLFKKLKGAIDLNYSPINTSLILESKKLKIKRANGLYMLVAQAFKSNELFCGLINDEKVIDKVYKEILLKNANIILTGMPGAGKTTIAKIIAKDLHLPFFDTDYEFEKTYGRTTAEDIIKFGVKEYRERETSVIEKMSNLKGVVIATGGGVFTIDKNREFLEKNAIVFFVKRKISKLDTSNRPLVKMSSPKKLYRQRKEIYYNTADFIVENKRVETAVKKIKEIIK